MESKEIRVYGTLVNQTEGSVKDTTHNDAIVKSYQVYDDRFGAGGTADYQDNINKRVKAINHQSGDPDTTTISGKLVVTNGMDVTGNSTVDNLQVDGNENVSGNLNVNGSTTLKNTTINGTETVNGISNVTGNQTIGGSLDVNGTTTLRNTVIDGNETITGNTTINGTTTLKNTVINGTETINGNQTVTGNQTVGGNTTVQGDITVEGDQIVDGSITIKGETIIEGTTQITGELTGDATLRNLTVTGSVSGIDLNDLDDVTGTGSATAGQVLKYNGSKWAPAEDSVGGGSSTADLNTATGTLDPSKIGQGGATNGQILVYNSSTGKWVPSNQSSGSGSSGGSSSPWDSSGSGEGISVLSGDFGSVNIDLNGSTFYNTAKQYLNSHSSIDTNAEWSIYIHYLYLPIPVSDISKIVMIRYELIDPSGIWHMPLNSQYDTRDTWTLNPQFLSSQKFRIGQDVQNAVQSVLAIDDSYNNNEAVALKTITNNTSSNYLCFVGNTHNQYLDFTDGFEIRNRSDVSATNNEIVEALNNLKFRITVIHV